MNERTLIERLNNPWPEHETEEVTLPAWVIELCAEGAARITALEAQLAEARKALGEIEQEARSLPLHTSAVTWEHVLTFKLAVVRDAARRTLETQEIGR